MKYSHLKLNFNDQMEFPLIKVKTILYPTHSIGVLDTIKSHNEISSTKQNPHKYAVVIDNNIMNPTNPLYGCLSRYHHRDKGDILVGLYGFEIKSINAVSTINIAEGEIKYRIDDDVLEVYRSRLKRFFYEYYRMKQGLPPQYYLRKFVKNSYDMLRIFYENNETGLNYTEPLTMESEFERLELIRLFLLNTYGIQ